MLRLPVTPLYLGVLLASPVLLGAPNNAGTS
jgi:hypothetical protein